MDVAFLWHMHQPHYLDTIEGVSVMPWARMHATKGYLDMIWLVEQYPEFRCTFNLTPVLLTQIEQLANNEIRDLWLQWTTTPADELTPEQKCALLEHHFKANWENMIKPYPRYWSLLQKRGMHTTRQQLPEITTRFDTQEYRDLQVWFHLTWCGYAACRLHPELADLKQKGGNFTENDKQTLLACQQSILRSLVERYKSAAERGQIELSTSPFYHPILPLIYNTDFARRCMPGCRLPSQFSRPEDVRAQLDLARSLHRKLFS
ncbi:MAG: alpha-amylase, partial [Verrucomicrobiae bacterium]|nr:alpha-amylase [Verrucomicrobiae bacterium]